MITIILKYIVRWVKSCMYLNENKSFAELSQWKKRLDFLIYTLFAK